MKTASTFLPRLFKPPDKQHFDIFYPFAAAKRIKSVSIAMKKNLLASICCACFASSFVLAGDERQVEVAKQGGFVPKIQEASDEGVNALKQFKLSEGLKIDLWAAEPLLANPVAIATDERGRWFVAETFRLHAGVSDIRAHMNWLEDELASTTLESWLRILKADPSVDFEKNAKNSERVQMVWDSKGTGKADSSKIFAEGFNEPLSGIAAGVLARKGSVYLTNIPDLWLLKDTTNSGTADSKTSLSRGFGVRTAFLGHDLHGLRIGPDGRLYFSIGDRGANATAIDGSKVVNTETGAVYRCELDGSKLEIFAKGLRNPQELAFDKFGNLFTGDNNSDAGDPARWVYVMQNSDSGWRIGWQFITRPDARGPWLAERLCFPAFPGQAAYHLPPVAILGNGPSGLTYHPGTGLSPAWKDRFFLANFRGSSASSGILSVAVTPKGAGFQMSPIDTPVGNILATDVEFGVDGGLYLSDWVTGWGMTGKGRIYRVTSADESEAPLLEQTRSLIADGMEKRPVAELVTLLSHPDMRVRQESQFELASRGDLASMNAAAAKASGQLARLHAIWGMGQVARQKRQDGSLMLPLMTDADPEVRAQAVKMLGDLPPSPQTEAAAKALLGDSNSRVRSFAAITLGCLKSESATPALLQALAENNNADPALRHALTIGLEGCGSESSLAAAATHPSAAARLGAVVALRRKGAPALERFLSDPDPLVVAEAARAIHDEFVDPAMPALASMHSKASALATLPEGSKEEPGQRDAILKRVINANFRLGKPSNADALVQLASLPDAPEAMRVQSLQQLGLWDSPPRLDRITGLHRPLEKRDSAIAATALRPAIAKLIARGEGNPPALRLAAIELVKKHLFKDISLRLEGLVADEKEPEAIRAAALAALAARSESSLVETVNLASTDKSETLRKEATRLRVELHLPGGGAESLAKILSIGTAGEKQSALDTLGSIAEPAAAAVLEEQLQLLLEGKLAEELHLDLLQAAAKRQEPNLKTLLGRYEASVGPEGSLGSYRAALKGGNAAEGRKIFMEKPEASCIRCHKVNNEGAEVGPVLSAIGKRQTREYLLESIVDPNAKIAAGFETVLITLKDGSIHGGILKGETSTEVTLMQPTGMADKIQKDQIKTRERGPSGMPAIAQLLTKREIRNLVEYLATLK
jgi:quinoprotein glucose dehydrogenase